MMKRCFTGRNFAVSLAVVFCLAALIGCHQVEHSASKAFDNANSVIRHGEKKLFVESEGDTPAEESSEENEEEADLLK